MTVPATTVASTVAVATTTGRCEDYVKPKDRVSLGRPFLQTILNS